MSERAQEPEEKAEESTDAGQEAGGKSKRHRMGDGIKQGVGFLSAFKDALEETVQEARERGDLSAERAKEVVKEALDKAQAAGERARDRLDFAHQADVDSIREAIDAIGRRVSKLEASVFGPSGVGNRTEPAGAREGAGESKEAEEPQEEKEA